MKHLRFPTCFKSATSKATPIDLRTQPKIRDAMIKTKRFVGGQRSPSGCGGAPAPATNSCQPRLAMSAILRSLPRISGSCRTTFKVGCPAAIRCGGSLDHKVMFLFQTGGEGCQ